MFSGVMRGCLEVVINAAGCFQIVISLPDSDINGDDRRHQNTVLYRLPINFKIV